MQTILTYSNLIRLPTFDERYNYLKLDGIVGMDTFGHDRFLNQRFYRSTEWKRIRDQVITREMGCDLGIRDREINDRIYVHHMNPMQVMDLVEFDPHVLNPEFLITVSFDTHNAIHYGDERLLHRKDLVIRNQNDTCPWKGV